jgi:S-adenosylmethionine hydrolase
MMQIITLTTDMGLLDHYVAALKGSIFSLSSDVQIVDISHQVNPFDVSQEAFFVKSCYHEFPKGTIHLCTVDSEPVINFGSSSSGSFPSIMLYEGHYFVSNDNGFFGLLLDGNRPEKFWRLDDVMSNPNMLKFPIKNILVPATIKISQKIEIETFATESDYKRAFSINAVTEENLIRGNVVHIDHFGNIITNISKELFHRIGQNAPFTIYFRRKEYYIEEISNTYSDVVEGEKVAIFNSNEMLEIAINRGANGRNGGASSLFGINLQDIVRIEFTPRGSKQTLESLF